MKCKCGSSFRKDKWHQNKHKDVTYGYSCYNRIRHGDAKKHEELGLDTDGFCDMKMICEWKMDLMAKTIFDNIWVDRQAKGFDAALTAEAGVIVLGNIDADRFDINKNMVEHISEVFGESATLDRFHEFIPGWKIPPMKTGMIAKGWAINTEYFAEVMHVLRDDLSYAIDVPVDYREGSSLNFYCLKLTIKTLYFTNKLN